MGAERRRHPRLKLEIDVDVTSGHNFFSTRTRDASEGGLFIESDLPLPIGSAVNVVIRLPGMPGLEVAAEVTWALTDDSGAQTGLGLRFLSMPDRSREAIQRFMSARTPMLFEEDAAEPEPPPLPRR